MAFSSNILKTFVEWSKVIVWKQAQRPFLSLYTILENYVSNSCDERYLDTLYKPKNVNMRLKRTKDTQITFSFFVTFKFWILFE